MAMSNARSGWWRYSRRAHSAVISGKLLNTSSASATGSRATAEYRHRLCTAISTPMSGRALR